MSSRNRITIQGLTIASAALLAAGQVFAFRAEPHPDLSAGFNRPAAAQGDAVETRKQHARELQGADVRWNARRGSPSLISSPNLLQAAGASDPAVKGLKGVARAEAAAINVMAGLAPLYGLADAKASLQVKRSSTDVAGYRHVRLQQIYQGLPVVGGGTIVHFDSKGACRSVNGRIIPDLHLTITPRRSAAAAGVAVLKAFGQTGNPAGTLAGPAQLVVWARGAVPRLAYELEVRYAHPEGGTGQWRYVVDANSGQIVTSYDNRHCAGIAAPGGNGAHEEISGTVLTGEGGAVHTFTGWHDDDSAAWYMWNKTNTWYIQNFDTTGWPDAGTYCNRDSNDWGTSDPSGFSLAVNFESTLTFYREVLGRNSYDNGGSYAIANLHVFDNFVNAFWSPADQQFFFGDGDGAQANALTVVDVAAHEFQHAVTEHTANLIYQGESGALNESMSDIFGALVEIYGQPDGRATYPGSTPGHGDWLVGEDCWLQGSALRDMRNPRSTTTLANGYQQPSRFEGTLWYDPTGGWDNGGVHHNSGVQNFFFYLLCEGGSGNNDGIDYNVAGIGVEAGAQLAMLALEGYMNSGTDYPDARDAWVAAAQEADDAGLTTNSVLPVILAWAAVGLGSSEQVVPNASYIAVGEMGVAPYLPTNKTYTVMNFDSTAATWSITAAEPWLALSPAALVIPPLSSGFVTASIVDNVATGMAEGIHTDVISFENVTPGQEGVYTRDAFLRIGDNYALQSTSFKWIDPIARGHALVGMSGGASGPLPIAFDFSLYGTNYSTLYVSSRGYITFTGAGLSVSENLDLPATNAPNSLVAPYWDALKAVQGSSVRIGSIGAPPERFRVVTWLNMAHEEDPGLRVSFQVLIRESPSLFEDNDIIYQYLDVDTASGYGAGRGATIGIEGIDGFFFRKYSFDGEQELANGQAMLLTMEPESDTVAPTGNVLAVEGAAGAIALYPASETQLTMEMRFSEIVTGLELSDLELDSNIPGATLGALTGSGERYRVGIEGLNTHGFVSVGVKAAAVKDISGNPNEAFGPGIYVVPLDAVAFDDDMESGPDRWTPSEGVFAEYTREGWEFGQPGYIFGPASVPSGSNCWGTVLNSAYPDYMNGWVESDWISVGPNPVLEYAVWYDIEAGYDHGYVEVDNGSGWINVTPADSYSGFSEGWLNESVDLDPATFGSRQIRVRFRLLSDYSASYAGLYFDDVRLLSRKGPGVWVYTYTPTNAAPDSSSAVVFAAYNTDTQTYHAVSADVASLSPGLGLSGTVTYGDIGPGSIVTGTTVMASFGAVGLFNDPLAKFSHAVTATEGVLNEEYLPIEVAGVSPATGTNQLTATSDAGVVDWMDQPLRGDGTPGSSLFQVIYAGTNGTADAPGAGGGTTADDVVLFASDNLTPYGLFGVGPTTPADVGRFDQTFKHGLASNAVIYVRAWDGVSYAASVAYGDSDPAVIAGLAAETQDFGTWIVGTPIDMERDLNGDTIPDGFDVLQGRDASSPVEPLEPQWTSVAIAGGTRGDGEEEMESPGRVVATSNFVFVADTRNNRIQVWLPDLSAVMSTFVGSGDFAMNWPEGIALDVPNSRLVVADTKNHRIVLLDVNLATGALSGNSFFGTQGSGSVQFQSPYGVAVDILGDIYVADTYNHRVQKLTPDGLSYGYIGEAGNENGQFFLPKGLCVDGDGLIYVAEGNHRVQIFDDTGAYVTNFGSSGSAVGEFISPSGVQLGVAGRLVVADQGAHRVQLFASNHVALAAYKPPVGERGSLPGQLWLPQGVWPMPDGNAIYVADTWNHRVQLLNMILDTDGDGMNDAWEDANGDCLDSSVADGDGDADGDGLSNVGEYRAGTDPCVVDSDGDFAGDLWEMRNGYDPLKDDFDGVFLTDLAVPGGHAVQWNVDTGMVYRVEGATGLLIPDWLPLSTITSSAEGLLTWTNAPAPTNDAYFYRIIRE